MIRRTKHKTDTTTGKTEPKGQTMTTTKRPRVTSEQRTATHALVRAVDEHDLGHLLTDTRAALDRAKLVGAEFATARTELRDRLAHLADNVVAGDTTPADAVHALAPIAVERGKIDHVDGTLAAQLERQVADALEAEAVQAARRDAGKVHDSLSKQAAQLVDQSIDAARQLLDLDDYAATIQRVQQQARKGPHENVWDSDRGCLRGWPRVNLDGIEPIKLGTVGTLRDLAARMRALHHAGRIVAALDQTTASTLYRTPGTRSDESDLRWVPPELHLPVAARLGWTPGLWRTAEAQPRPGQQHTTRKPRPPRDAGEDDMRAATRAAVASVPDQQHETRAGQAFAGLGRFLPGGRS
ncbi:hypothetical protein GCM10009676_31150 [Prauserella halophila]|uniref:DUF222 domain-containing protein n=1 Tax=Prauserella halophila TaxID=185641 RepID=A0ABN1WBM2_9PSEU|nr:hypothetical protein [Prauserella halophila]MCP2234740.1 hypothetical protein [Prauserella halophila]